MAGTHRQRLKLLYLMRIFTEDTDEASPLTMEQLLARLEAYGIEGERRSVYSDINLLRDFGLDIIGEKRKRYVYYLGSREFELAELKLLVDTVAAAKVITEKKSRQLIQKLAALTSRQLAGQLRRQVYVSDRVKTFNEAIYYNVDAIHQGIQADRRISFRYFDYGLNKARVFRRQGERYQISPYLLSWDNENYYLVAYHGRYDRLAHFRVDKMTEVRLEDEKRHPLGENIDPAAYCRQMFGMFAGEERRIRIRFAAALLGVVIDRFGQDTAIVPADGDWFTATVRAAVSPVFLAWLIQFGPRAVVLDPPEVREQIRRLLADTLANYPDNTPPPED
ncbi:MAG: WYL domain-containing protein [Peptococcaceae bacterium]|nr:WYL domain-containing protein [Peptococcaceae bacterium]